MGEDNGSGVGVVVGSVAGKDAGVEEEVEVLRLLEERMEAGGQHERGLEKTREDEKETKKKRERGRRRLFCFTEIGRHLQLPQIHYLRHSCT